MIHVENDYEPIIYKQPLHSHIHQNHDLFLLSYYTRPLKNNKSIENIVEEVTGKKPVECSSANHIYQNLPKETKPKEKIWTIPLLLESPKSKEFQTPGLEICFLIDSGAELNIINIPTWNEIKTLHPKLISS